MQWPKSPEIARVSTELYIHSKKSVWLLQFYRTLGPTRLIGNLACCLIGFTWHRNIKFNSVFRLLSHVSFFVDWRAKPMVIPESYKSVVALQTLAALSFQWKNWTVKFPHRNGILSSLFELHIQRDWVKRRQQPRKTRQKDKGVSFRCWIFKQRLVRFMEIWN